MTPHHTPGPWWRDDDGFIASGSDETYITVASPNCSEDIDIDEREANARLMAASPELLAAARHLLPRARMAQRLSKADMLLLESVIAKATQP